VRELVILSPYRADRSAVGVALSSGAADARLTSRLAPAVAGTGIEVSTRSRRGTIHEFKGLEAPAVILTYIDLSKEHHRDLLYVGRRGRRIGWWCSSGSTALRFSLTSTLCATSMVGREERIGDRFGLGREGSRRG